MILEYIESFLLAGNRIQNPIYLFLRRFINYKKLIKRSYYCDIIKDIYLSNVKKKSKSEPKILLLSFVRVKGNDKIWDLILLDRKYKFIKSIRINSGDYNLTNFDIKKTYYVIL